MASMLVAYGAAFGEGPSVMAEVLPYAAFSAQLRKSSRTARQFPHRTRTPEATSTYAF